jgi:hypothetical protein
MSSKTVICEAVDQSRREHLQKLINDFERDQQIQDVGRWFIDDTMDPLPPKLVAVLREWLETHNELTIKQNRRGNPHSDIRNAYFYITRLHRDTGMALEAACIMVAEELKLETDPTDLRRMYDRSRIAETRYLNEFMKSAGAFSNQEAPLSKTQAAALRLKSARAKRNTKAEQKAKSMLKAKANRKAKAEQKKQ